jgi:hypothetical protein
LTKPQWHHKNIAKSTTPNETFKKGKTRSSLVQEEPNSLMPCKKFFLKKQKARIYTKCFLKKHNELMRS